MTHMHMQSQPQGQVNGHGGGHPHAQQHAGVASVWGASAEGFGGPSSSFEFASVSAPAPTHTPAMSGSPGRAAGGGGGGRVGGLSNAAAGEAGLLKGSTRSSGSGAGNGSSGADSGSSSSRHVTGQGRAFGQAGLPQYDATQVYSLASVGMHGSSVSDSNVLGSPGRVSPPSPTAQATYEPGQGATMPAAGVVVSLAPSGTGAVKLPVTISVKFPRHDVAWA